MVVSQNKGDPNIAQNSIVLIMGTPRMVPPILGNPQKFDYISEFATGAGGSQGAGIVQSSVLGT